MIRQGILFCFLGLSFLLTACDDGGSSSSRDRYANTYNPYYNQSWMTSPQGSNCVYQNGRYQEVFLNGYNTGSVYNYRNSFDPFNPYLPNGSYNTHYRDPYYANSGCSDMNRLIQTQGFYAFQGDFRVNINGGCPYGTQPAGFSWGMVCVSASWGVNVNTSAARYNGNRGQQCNVITDRHCDCRPITAHLGTNPSQAGICWN
tara:strand:+ start:80022 stop:80627 length:606 start_codon:yes stop_codon:yes gene_type:complete